jgi:TetR/AcrR family transcriptional regulator, repressor for uid operon
VRKVDPAKHEQKRQEILEAAGRCFVRDGFRGASTSKICEEAGISPGHLYHYFSSKEAIISAMVEVRLVKTAKRFAEIADSADIVAELTSELGTLHLKHRNAGQSLLFEMMAEAARKPAMAKIVHRHTQGMRMLLAGLLRKGQADGRIDSGLDPEIAAAVLISSIDGSTTLAIRNPGIDRQQSAAAWQTMLSRFLAG